MSYVGGGWRSGQASDITGAAATCTVTTLTPSTAAKGSTFSLQVNGTGFNANTIVYAGYNPQGTVFVSATQLTVPNFVARKDDGTGGAIAIAARKPGEVLCAAQTFTAT